MMSNHRRRRVVTGHYAGLVSRALAFAVDGAAAGALYAAGTAALAWVARTLLDVQITPNRARPVWLAVFLVWLFLYQWVGLALVGKTVGMAIVGLRVVARAGSPLTPSWAALRVLVMPISFAVMGLGLIGAVVSRERRTLHDVIARTVVIYDWGGRSAELPTFLSTWLDRRGVGKESSLSPTRSGSEAGEKGPSI
jgi:uncharacterized RDD family membrane protein YckC